MTLEEMIKTGLMLVQNDPHHDLGVSFRCQLLSFVDQVPSPSDVRVPHWKRVKLMRLSVEKVLNLWEFHLPSDRTPHEALEVADKVVIGAIPATAANTLMGKYWTHCDDLAFKCSEQQFVIMVGYGAAQVIREALSDAHFGCEQVNEAASELDIDPYDHDSAFCAATAYSGGASWEDGSDSRKRLEFWKWWLTSAVGVALRGT